MLGRIVKPGGTIIAKIGRITGMTCGTIAMIGRIKSGTIAKTAGTTFLITAGGVVGIRVTSPPPP
jgi:hypothetical protein